jgi:hypothetical protein
MPFTHTEYSRLRPFVYHLTARENLAHIRDQRRLDSSAALLAKAERTGEVRRKRHVMTPAHIGSATVLLRDQRPLHERNIAYAPGWRFEDVLEDLNWRVFFWPGGAGGPIPHGRRYIERYLGQGPIILRAHLASLLWHNPARPPHFCRYNSGSPRYSGGKPSYRGPDLFLPAERFPGTPGGVVEVTFLERVMLPEDTEYTMVSAEAGVADPLAGTWARLFPGP